MTTEKYTPHVHAEVIKAWADGKKIQFKGESSDKWLDADMNAGQWLMWSPAYSYRIKPEEIVDYTVVPVGGRPGAVFTSTISELPYYYTENNYQGYMKRIRLDGKVVSFEFIPK